MIWPLAKVRMIAACIVTYLLIVLLMFLGQRGFTYFPPAISLSPAKAGLAEMKPFEARTEDGLTLTAWYAPPGRPDGPVVIFFHGNATSISYSGYKARPFLDAGYGFLLAEYRGYNGNPGKPDEQGLYRDARACMEWLARERGVPQERIVLYGESLGTGVAVHMATLYPGVKAVLLESPFTSMAAVAQTHYFWLPAYWLVRDRYENIRKIPQLAAPLLVVHGKKDLVVPYRQGVKLFTAAGAAHKNMETLPAAGHNDLAFHGAGRAALSFVENLDR